MQGMDYVVWYIAHFQAMEKIGMIVILSQQFANEC